MTRHAALFVALATILALAGAPATGPTADPPPARFTVAVDYYIQLGDLFTTEKRFDAARTRYATAATLARADGLLPAEAVRRIANTYYFEGTYKKAEATLIELADEAALTGDRETQIWATADAAWLAELAGDKLGLARHLQHLDALLNAHQVPGSRYKVRTMLLKDFTVFAPHLTSW